jgi:hypothetical protein
MMALTDGPDNFCSSPSLFKRVPPVLTLLRQRDCSDGKLQILALYASPDMTQM